MLSSLPLIDALKGLKPSVSETSRLKDLTNLAVLQFVQSEKMDILFKNSGTDKSSNGYSPVYSTLLTPLQGFKSTLIEVGIGTNNINLPSHMGMSGVPGASLRAFSIFLGQETQIYGLDIDRSIFFETETIRCEYVDQLDGDSFTPIKEILKKEGGADVIIDDGLHRPVSCLNTLTQLLPFLKIGGFFVIEDQDPTLNKYWNFVLAKLGSHYDWRIVSSREDISIILIQRTK